MKEKLGRIGLWLLRFIICYVVLYLLAIFCIKPEIPDSNISFFCWLAALITVDLEEIKDKLDKDGN